MNRNYLSALLKYEYEKIKRFATSKDLLVFLFFLAVSAALWTLRALHKNYETVITVPVTYENLPSGIASKNSLPETFRVTVNDDGTSLFRYRWIQDFNAIAIDAGKYADGNHNISTAVFESEIQKQIKSSTKILRISPSLIELDLSELTKRTVPVKANTSISIAQQYVQCGEVEIEPREVTLYGTRARLDTINEAVTLHKVIDNVKDTLSTEIYLKAIPDVTFAFNKVTCTIKTEPFTEKTVKVDIAQDNVPAGYKLRTFPSSVELKFQIGMSKYKTINGHHFTVRADYERAVNNKIQLTWDGPKETVHNVMVTPAAVDFILEKNEEKK